MVLLEDETPPFVVGILDDRQQTVVGKNAERTLERMNLGRKKSASEGTCLLVAVYDTP